MFHIIVASMAMAISHPDGVANIALYNFHKGITVFEIASLRSQ